MSTNISLFGLTVRIVADRTFPAGFTLTQWADDAPPLESPAIETGAFGIGPNGDMVVWQKPAAISSNFAVVPNSEDDRNLAILHEANRISKSKGIVPMDKITAVLSYQDGRVVTLSQGIIMSGPAAPGGTQDGRLTSRVFGFVFEDRNESRPS
ncbi:hypothetical protein D3C79_718020 [compost metagenome]